MKQTYKQTNKQTKNPSTYLLLNKCWIFPGQYIKNKRKNISSVNFDKIVPAEKYISKPPLPELIDQFQL